MNYRTRSHRFCISPRLLALALAISPMVRAQAVLYNILELPPAATFSGSSANGMNQFARVAGASDYSAGRATRWIGNVPTNLGSGGWTRSYANGINDSDEIVGTLETLTGGTASSFYWKNGVLTAMGNPGGCSDSYANDINNAGTAIGYGIAPTGQLAYKWSMSGGYTLLGNLPGGQRSLANAINQGGDIVGGSQVALGSFKPFHGALWKANGTKVDLGIYTGDTETWATDINLGGRIVGYSRTTSFAFRAITWAPGSTSAIAMSALSGLGHTQALALNNLNQMVGVSAGKAAIWTNATTVADLNSLVAPGSTGWNLQIATDINGAGQIVGTGIYNGKGRAFLATPVPEPASIGGVLAGLLAIVRRRKAAANRSISVVVDAAREPTVS